jgi:hypothetical protein
MTARILAQLRVARSRGDRAAVLILQARLATIWCQRCTDRCVRPGRLAA